MRLLLLAPLCFSGTIALAQNPTPRVGLLAAMSQSRVEGGASDISNRSGTTVGAYALAPVSGGWSLQGGVVWTQKGWERDEPGTRDLAVVKLTYVEIPLLLRYDVAPRSRLGALFFAGPGFGFRSGCSIETTRASTGQSSGGTCAEIERASNGSLTFNSFDVGAIAGAGARFAVGRARFIASAQYELGLKSVQSSSDLKNRSATFGLGLELPFGRR